MSNRIYVAPAAGKTPRSPLLPYERIPADGYWQTDCAAWRRAERDGDVVISTSAPSPAPAERAAKSKI